MIAAMFSTDRLRRLAVVALGAAAVACSSPPEPASLVEPVEPVEEVIQGTYVGSWMQPVPVGWSTITIAEGPAGLQFSWTAESSGETVRCDAPGVCRSYRDGKAQFEYRFRMFERADSPFPFVECQGMPLAAGAEGPLRYVDRLELAAGGMELWAHTVEAAGFTANPPVKLTRITGSAP